MRDRKSGHTTPRLPRVLVFSRNDTSRALILRLVREAVPACPMVGVGAEEEVERLFARGDADIAFVDHRPTEGSNALALVARLRIALGARKSERFGVIVGVERAYLSDAHSLTGISPFHNLEQHIALKPYDVQGVKRALDTVTRKVFAPIRSE